MLSARYKSRASTAGSDERPRGPRREYALAIGAALTWGAFHPVSKLALHELSPAGLTFLRIGLGLVTLVALAWIFGEHRSLHRPTRSELTRLLVAGVCGNFLSAYLVTVGLRLLPAAVGSLISNMSPLLVALLAPLMLGEPLGRYALVGLALGIGGVSLLLAPGADPSGGGAISPLGAMWTLLGGAGWAIYNLLSRRLLSRYPPIALTAAAQVVSLPCLLVAWLLEGGDTPLPEHWAGYLPHLFWLGVISTGLGFGAWMVALRGLRAASLAPFQYFVPVASVGFSYLLLGEQPNPTFLLGAGLVLSGVALAQVRR